MNAPPQICGLLLLPERKDALAAVGRFILLIRRRYALSAVEIAKSLKKEDGTAPIVDTIERAEKGAHILGFDLIAQLAYLYPDAADPIRNLLTPATSEPVSLEERLAHAEREILAVRRELAAKEDSDA